MTAAIMEGDEANGPIAMQLQRVCHDTLPWLISFSLDRMLTPSELDKSLQELERADWGEPTYDSYLVTTVHRLRRVPLGQFSVEDLRIMIGQSIGLPYLVPLALQHLGKDPLAEGDFYPGDLLKSVLTVDQAFWRDHPQWRDEVRDIASTTLARLHSLKPEDEDYSDVVLDSLTEGWKVFASAPHAV